MRRYHLPVPSLDVIRRALAAHRPERLPIEDRKRAAVALVLRPPRGADPAHHVPEVLFIERAEREGDPWSGQMAFPGGRIDPGDRTSRLAAERETLEEVGVDLADAEILGRLDDLAGHRSAGVPGIVISAYVYRLPGDAELSPNHEVRKAFWFPLESLLDPDRQVDYPMRRVTDRKFPGILVGEPDRHVVWGLTYRFLEVFFEALGHPMPKRWNFDQA